LHLLLDFLSLIFTTFGTISPKKLNRLGPLEKL